MLYEINILIAK